MRGHKRKSEASYFFMLGLLALCAIAICYVAQYLVFPSNGGDASASGQSNWAGTIVINELMSANASAYADDTGSYEDWLEIANVGEEPVSLTGWTLRKASGTLSQFDFPNQTLAPGEYVIVFASKSGQNTAGYAYHAPFKITAAGDSISLLDASGDLVDSVNTPSLGKNQVYMRAPDTLLWTIADYDTPGAPNTTEAYAARAALAGAAPGDLRISEVMSKNRTYVHGADGQREDYIEVQNVSGRPINLQGYSLSDARDNLSKFVFPSAVLAAGECTLVYASGKNGYPHAAFQIASNGEAVYLSNPAGRIVDSVNVPALAADQAYERGEDDAWRTTFVPTPGYPVGQAGVTALDADARAGNAYGLFINEVMASTNEVSVSSSGSDWLELWNSSSVAIDLSGFGLSDNPNRPRAWQFPQGASIGPNQYLVVFLSGEDSVNLGSATYHTNFRMSADGGSLVLSTPEGAIVDRLPMPQQYTNISYGRAVNREGLYFFTEATPRASNTAYAYAGRADEAVFSSAGGLFEAGGQVALTLWAPAGSTIRYTLDCTEPSEYSTLYTGPISISQNTIVRAKVYGNGQLPSLVRTQSYFFGLSHEMRVVSLVSDPVNLFDEIEGIYVKGPNAWADYPYGSNNKGANFWMDWEKEASVEVYERDGTALIAQECGLKLQGQYSRAEDQKAFKLIARTEYGDNRFHAPLFSGRDDLQYQSFILRASGQDSDKTRMKDSILTTLAEGTGVMYQETELCVVYLNGQYWGHYNMRERINKYSIAQWEGWQSDPDDIDIIKANRTVMQGSNESYAAMLEWIAQNGCQTEENLAYVGSIVDIDNYLDYVAVEMYIGNTDLLNVKRYRSTNEDGKWRFILFDTDWAFNIDTNSINRWLTEGGVGTDQKTDNSLFIALMKNSSIQDKFLRRFGELLATSWNTEAVLAKIDRRYQELLPEIDRQLERWGVTRRRFEDEVKAFKDYAIARPGKILGYIQAKYDFSDEQMQYYFAEALAQIEAWNAKAQ